MPRPEQLKERIEAAIPDARVEVTDLTGGGDHFRAKVVAPEFAQLSRICLLYTSPSPRDRS